MIKTLSDLYREEDTFLAPYSIKNIGNGERIYPEPEHPFRLPFQRDRDRILHARAFKRLEYKTQVFINSEGDNFRTRLTHTLEVAGVSRAIARSLGLNVYLAETIALAHDLGHPPFGHAGQDILAELMKNNGGFEHNKQSLRVVQKLENRYPEFHGLNLCIHTLVGIMKHGGDYDESELNLTRNTDGPSLEAMIVDFSDEIAYNNHDIEDGLEKEYINIDELNSVSIWKDYYGKMKKTNSTENLDLVVRKTIREILNSMVIDIIQNTSNNLKKYNIVDIHDLKTAWKNGIRPVGYSKTMSENVKELKKFLHAHLYHHPKVMDKTIIGQKIIEVLFHYYTKHSNSIPDSYKNRIEEEGVYRVVTDYIAGMTDRYAEQKYDLIINLAEARLTT